MREIIPPVLSRAHRDRLVANGLRILETDCTAGRDAEALFANNLDLLVHVLHADLRDADRVDVEIRSPQGNAFLSFMDVPFDASRGEVLIACQRHYRQLAAMSDDQPVFRVIAVKGGAPHVVGDYLVKHIWPD
jgi:hypothetical protein